VTAGLLVFVGGIRTDQLGIRHEQSGTGSRQTEGREIDVNHLGADFTCAWTEGTAGRTVSVQGGAGGGDEGAGTAAGSSLGWSPEANDPVWDAEEGPWQAAGVAILTGTLKIRLFNRNLYYRKQYT